MSQSGYSGRDNRSVEYCWHSDFTIGTVAKLLSRHKHESFLRMLRMVDVGYLIA